MELIKLSPERLGLLQSGQFRRLVIVLYCHVQHLLPGVKNIYQAYE